MKKMKILLAFALALALSLTASAMATEAVYSHLGEAMPDFTVTTIDGGSFTLSEALAEKDAVMINLWATWCGPCEMEFPYIQEAYEMYKDRVEIIALSVEPNDTEEVLRDYAEAHGLTFPIGREEGLGLRAAFASVGIPTTLIVDRFGNIGFIEIGAQSATEIFTRLFDAFVGEDYTETTVLDELPPLLPSVERPDEAALAAALNAEGGDIAFRNPEDETVWPMVPVEKDGRDAVISTGAGVEGAEAAVLATVTAEEGDALAFDFATSTEVAMDLLKIDIDGETAKVFGGEHDWTAWALPLAPGEHEIAFRYVKDYYVDDGEDAVWLDEVRLVSGAEAEALLAGLPAYPTAEAFEIKMTSEGAREIAFDGDEADLQTLYEGFFCQSYWIVPGGSVEAMGFLTADIDPEGASSYSNYDGAQIPLLELLDEAAGGYALSSGIDTMDTTGYAYSNLYIYPRGDVETYEELQGIMVFADEENVNAFIEELAADRSMPIVLTWAYVDGAAPSTDAAAEGASAGEAAYTAVFTDQNGDPVPGCIVNFCTDVACTPVVAGEDGVAEYTGEPYAYHLQVIKVPEGYSFDTTQEFYADEAGGTIEFTVNKD